MVARRSGTEIPEDSDFTSIQERLHQFVEPHQAKTTMPPNPISKHPPICSPWSVVNTSTHPKASPPPCLIT